MLAFHNDIKIKNKYLKRVKQHEKADEIIKGTYWENGKGCAVGCTIHGSDHKLYETELGIPEWLARLEDALFEGMNNEAAKEWPRVFLSTIKPGVDLENIKVPFLLIVLEENLSILNSLEIDKIEFPEIYKAIECSKSAVNQMIEAQKSENEENIRSAAWSAGSAAELAAWSARPARLAWSARLAAESAESAARSAAELAAWSAGSAAELAASSAWSARLAAGSAASSARSAKSAAFDYYAIQLLGLIENLNKSRGLTKGVQ